MVITIKNIFIALGMTLLMNASFAQSIDQKPNNSTVRGDGEATQKDFTFNTGLGASNPKLFTTDGTQLGAFTQNLTVGNGSIADTTITIDQGLGLMNPFLRWSSTISEWTFSNDGINATPIGVAVSNGVNTNNAFGFNDNPNGESGTSGWSYSGGGTFASLSTDPLEGVSSFTVTGGLISEFIQGPFINIDRATFRGRTCEVSIDYIGGVDGLILRVLDLGGAVVVENPLPVRTVAGPESISFSCPDSAQIAANPNLAQVRISIESPVLGNLSFFAFDRAYLGTFRAPLGQVSTGSSESYIVRICSWFDGSTAVSPTTIQFRDSCDSWTDNIRIEFANRRLEFDISPGIFPTDDFHCDVSRDLENPTFASIATGDVFFLSKTNSLVSFSFFDGGGNVFLDGGSIECIGRL